MKSAQREEAVRLRIEEQMSYGEIKKQLGVSKGTLSYWLQDLPLSSERMLELRTARQTAMDYGREKYRETMRMKRKDYETAIYEKQKKVLANISQDAFFVAGLMLYAAEGYKKSRYVISFTNTDHEMVKFFMGWMERFLGIVREDMKIQLRLYENMDIQAEEDFWLKVLGMSREQLNKTQIVKLRPNSFTYRDTSRHGTCILHRCARDKKAELMLSIRAFFDTYGGLRA